MSYRPAFARALLTCTALLSPTAHAVIPESGLYADPLRPGVGYLIEVQSDRIAFAMFVHAEDGEPEHYFAGGVLARTVSPGNHGGMHAFQAELYRSRDGFVAADRRAFVPPSGFAAERIGVVSIGFDALSAARLVVVLDRPPPLAHAYAESTLQRLPFGHAGVAAGNGYHDRRPVSRNTLSR